MLKAISFAFLVLLFSRSLSAELKQTDRFSTSQFDSLANSTSSVSLDSLPNYSLLKSPSNSSLNSSSKSPPNSPSNPPSISPSNPPSNSPYSPSNPSDRLSSVSTPNASFDSLLNLPSNLSTSSSLNSSVPIRKPLKISPINSSSLNLSLSDANRTNSGDSPATSIDIHPNSGDLKENRTRLGAKSNANCTDKDPLANKEQLADKAIDRANQKPSVNGPTNKESSSTNANTTSPTTSGDEPARTNGTTSSVVHLLSNEDIQEYHTKRKEEDNRKIELLKAKSNSKFEKPMPSRKGKSEDEKNEINHLQEIDLIDESPKEELKDLKEVTKPQLIIVSLDAMRSDYIRMFKSHMDNFQRMIKLGVSAPFGLTPAYITQTFPSHYSIVTGLYEEVNGIIDNSFYDPLFNETFKPFAMKSKFFGGEPIWNTAVKQGLESRVYFWPGSEVPISGYSPTEYMKFDLATPIKDQVEKVIQWAENGTDLCMLYHGQPDFAGHNFGIGSKEMVTAIKEINAELGVLIDYVKQKNINLIVTSDHGMVHFDRSKLIVLEDYLDFRNDVVRIPQFGSIAAIQVKEGKLDQVMAKLSEMPFTKCYKKKDIPEHYHYKHHYRIQQIICIPELTAYIIRTKDDPTPTFGIHGYDNRNPRMRTVFYAIGPDFKQNSITHPFENVNLYSLFAHVLHLNPAPNNGSIHNLKHLLSETSLARLI